MNVTEIFENFNVARGSIYFSYVIRRAIGTICTIIKRENHPGGMLHLIKLQAKSPPPWVFFTFLKLCKWYQIVQNITYPFFKRVRRRDTIFL